MKEEEFDEEVKKLNFTKEEEFKLKQTNELIESKVRQMNELISGIDKLRRALI